MIHGFFKNQLFVNLFKLKVIVAILYIFLYNVEN